MNSIDRVRKRRSVKEAREQIEKHSKPTKRKQAK